MELESLIGTLKRISTEKDFRCTIVGYFSEEGKSAYSYVIRWGTLSKLEREYLGNMYCSKASFEDLRRDSSLLETRLKEEFPQKEIQIETAITIKDNKSYFLTSMTNETSTEEDTKLLVQSVRMERRCCSREMREFCEMMALVNVIALPAIIATASLVAYFA